MSKPWLMIILLLAIVPMTLANGYALSVLWAWFVADPFRLGAITWLQASGLWFLLQFLGHKVSTTKETMTTEEALIKIGQQFLTPFFYIAFAYLLKLIIGV